MNRLFTIAMVGIFALSLQGPGFAQKEVAPPPISPLLEDQQPLDHPETQESAAPPKQAEKKAKTKSAKNQKTANAAKVKKIASKKRQAVTKKKNQKAGTKKRPAATQHQAGPDEG